MYSGCSLAHSDQITIDATGPVTAQLTHGLSSSRITSQFQASRYAEFSITSSSVIIIGIKFFFPNRHIQYEEISKFFSHSVEILFLAIGLVYLIPSLVLPTSSTTLVLHQGMTVMS